MWRPRDRERFIGSYDPEREMPDPDRGPGDRWQSDAYRHTARDSRFYYRMNPDRVEDRYGHRPHPGRDYDMRWNRDARDMDRGGYGRGEWDLGGNYGGGGYRGGSYGDYGRGYGRGFDDYDRHIDRDRYYGSDRGWDYDRGDRFDDRFNDRFNDRFGSRYGGGRSDYDDRSGWDWERDRWRR